ncbi:alcohol dehydrogenase catalytic domain-containing protein [Flammeovirga yaeyamensis]|uniref:Alcohol dehydrogenase catalytic domain-containing protein n=1 Tax=Flammeovirga yaeyamensis TaxID=367791 RepID=A0AAX1NED8_9BACT|nr:zinc-binding alcohol dehydrogenase family protein [Flammeovirga yaeyamensis]MBB3699408.1 alcohol dehydrogenase [Flammeovirga yaeyamensis]NMF35333.1 zinc-binding alcohol dehydrogenase family protein [Flammeovirga yaeyamensis]QWG04193.1 alcohol dehydrogenase catalytic domain-containing protein [Flammeovirga yaeyamensis]
MKTIVLNKPGEFEVTETVQPTEELQAGEALVKVHRIGICGTDLHAYTGKQPFFTYPRILGHELGVEVLAVAEGVSNVKVGDKCSVEPYFNKTEDHAVQRGFTNCGENISVFGVHEDGGMREFFKIPAQYLHASKSLGYDQLALVETLSIGCHAVNRAKVGAEDTVLVIGAGPIGMGACQFAMAAGAKTVMLDINESRLDFCLKHIKVDGTVQVDQEADVTEKRIREQFDGNLPTVVIDATGNKFSMANTLQYTASAGRIVFVGLFPGDFSFHDPYFHKKELTIMASRNSLPADFDQIIEMIENGQIDTDPWITHKILFTDIADHFDSWLKPETGVIKAMLEL